MSQLQEIKLVKKNTDSLAKTILSKKDTKIYLLNEFEVQNQKFSIVLMVYSLFDKPEPIWHFVVANSEFIRRK